MLRTMLNTHPDLAVPRETRFLMESFNRRVKWGDLRVEANRRKAVDFIVNRDDAWFGRFDVDKDMATQRLMAAPPTLGSLIGTAFQLYAERNGKRRWGDKRPTLVLILPAIFAMFPDAQFVNIVRDPRAASASMKKLGWYDGNIGGGVELWVNCVLAARRATQRYRPDQIYNVQYEELAREPAAVLGRISSFLHLDTAHLDKMLSFHENVDEPVSEYHNRLDQPVNEAPVEGWRQELSMEEIAFIERQASRWMAVYGYERVASSNTEVSGRYMDCYQERTRIRQRNKLGQTKRALQYRYPVAARITTGQQRRYYVTRPLRKLRTKAAATRASAST